MACETLIQQRHLLRQRQLLKSVIHFKQYAPPRHAHKRVPCFLVQRMTKEQAAHTASCALALLPKNLFPREISHLLQKIDIACRNDDAALIKQSQCILGWPAILRTARRLRQQRLIVARIDRSLGVRECQPYQYIEKIMPVARTHVHFALAKNPHFVAILKSAAARILHLEYLIFEDELLSARSGNPMLFRRAMDGSPAVPIGEGGGAALGNVCLGAAQRRGICLAAGQRRAVREQ